MQGVSVAWQSRTQQEAPYLLCFVVQGDEPERSFKLGAALAYVANMRIFWLLTLGLGAPPGLCQALSFVHDRATVFSMGYKLGSTAATSIRYNSDMGKGDFCSSCNAAVAFQEGLAARTGIRMNAGHLVLAYMPPFQQAAFPVRILHGACNVHWSLHTCTIPQLCGDLGCDSVMFTLLYPALLGLW